VTGCGLPHMLFALLVALMMHLEALPASLAVMP
jgi:hypothetical protein